MGHVIVEANLCGNKKCIKKKMLVDTGATFTTITPELVEDLGVIKAGIKMDVMTGKGPTKVDTGIMELEINGKKNWVPIAISGFPSVIGVTSLESLGYKVDPVKMELEETMPLI